MAAEPLKTIFFWSSHLEQNPKGSLYSRDVDHFLSFPLDACENSLNFTLLNALLALVRITSRHATTLFVLHLSCKPKMGITTL